MVYPHGAKSKKRKGPSPWMCLNSPEGKKVFVKKENVLSVSRVGGWDQDRVTTILYIDDYGGRNREIVRAVIEDVEVIFKKLQY